MTVVTSKVIFAVLRFSNLDEETIMNLFNNAKKSIKGYIPVLQDEPDDDEEDLELGPSATNLEEPSLLGGCCDLTYKQRIVGFFMSAGTGLLFLFLVKYPYT